VSKEFYDKYGKLVDCFSCNCIEPCSKSDSPLCSEGYVFFAKDKIADLEVKLAESEEELLQKEKKIEDLILCEFVATILDFNKLSADNCRLREQLAEKDDEITQRLVIQERDYNQDKISFAVEQLEKVKEWFKRNATNDVNNNAVLLDHSCTGVLMLLDGKIEDLKG
jgi:hypothetical protein